MDDMAVTVTPALDVERVRADFPYLEELQDGKQVAFLDSAASSQKPRQVLDAMSRFYETSYANVHRGVYQLAERATAGLETAREKVRALLNAPAAREVIFVRNATEGINLVAQSWGRNTLRVGDEVLVTEMEHHSNLVPWQLVAERTGATIGWVGLHDDGRQRMEELDALLARGPKLVAVTHASNVLGTINPIEEIARRAHEAGALVLVDGAQAVPHMRVDVRATGADFYAFTAHKMYGPKGIGALYIRRKPRVRLEAQIHGGGHERGFRSGTLPTHQIVGFGEAARLAKAEMAADNERIRGLRDRLLKGIKGIEEAYVNGDLERRIPHNLNVSFNFVEGESLIMAVKDIAVSSGSACTSASLEPSYVLRALGRSDELAHSSLRMTIGRFTTEEEIDYAIATVAENVHRLRQLSSLAR